MNALRFSRSGEMSVCRGVHEFLSQMARIKGNPLTKSEWGAYGDLWPRLWSWNVESTIWPPDNDKCACKCERCGGDCTLIHRDNRPKYHICYECDNKSAAPPVSPERKALDGILALARDPAGRMLTLREAMNEFEFKEAAKVVGESPV
jgi:hypothetical protein